MPKHALDRLEWLTRLGQGAEPVIRAGGVVTEVTPAFCRVAGLSRLVRLGDCVTLEGGIVDAVGEVVRIEESAVTVKPFVVPITAGVGSLAWRRAPVSFNPHPSWKGRVIDALGRPIDGRPAPHPGDRNISTHGEAPAPLERNRIGLPLKTGVRVIDLFTPLCAGQRIGVFAGSGIGKSTLLAMLARSQGFDSVVVALVGERGREVREFVEDALGDGLAKAVMVVSTGDESPSMRRLAPRTAMTIAEYLRDCGENVLLIVDSVTRFAHAARDVALAAGEPPVARGYPPSVFSDLPKLLERAGPGEGTAGSITGIFSVLVDGDDHNDPVADSIRGTLDGHIVLDRAIADQGRFPAVNILKSISRLSQRVWTPDQAKLAAQLRSMIARFEETADMRLMGGYVPGSDAELDNAIGIVPRLYKAISQGPADAPSSDAFQEVARAISPKTAP